MSTAGTVVIADDDADIRALISLSARKAGAVVTAEVGTGLAALEAIRRYTPDLAILDISMPEMTGLEVCKAIRADPLTSRIRVMLLTAAVHPAAVAVGEAAGADAYESKPFSPRGLSVRIREVLQCPPRHAPHLGSVSYPTPPRQVALEDPDEIMG